MVFNVVGTEVKLNVGDVELYSGAKLLFVCVMSYMDLFI